MTEDVFCLVTEQVNSNNYGKHHYFLTEQNAATSPFYN